MISHPLSFLPSASFCGRFDPSPTFCAHWHSHDCHLPSQRKLQCQKATTITTRRALENNNNSDTRLNVSSERGQPTNQNPKPTIANDSDTQKENNTTGSRGRKAGNKPRIRNNQQQQQLKRKQRQKQQNPILSNSIDSFLAGEYAHPFSPDAPAPHPGLGPGETVKVSLQALRDLDIPHKSHGAAVFMRFCMPLTRGERWGSGIPLPSGDRRRRSSGNNHRGSRERFSATNSNNHDNQWPGHDQWKDLLRGAITPSMLARKLRSSTQFSGLLDWTSLDVTEGASNPNPSRYFISGSSDHIAYVNAALFFGRGLAPTILHFVLKRVGAAWFIDTVLVGSENEEDWLVNYDDCHEEGCDDDGTRLDEFGDDRGDGFVDFGLL